MCDQDVVSVAETTTNKRYAGYFIRYVPLFPLSPFPSRTQADPLPCNVHRNAEHAQRVLETIRAAPLPITRPAGTQGGDAQSGAGGQKPRGGAQAAGGGAGGRAAGQGVKAGGAAGRTSGNPWAR